MAATPAAPTAPVTTAPKVSWWKRALNEVGKIIGFVEKEEPKIQAIALPALQAAFPQFAVLIGGVGTVATKIVNEMVAVQAVGAAAATAPTGVQRLESVLGNVGPALDEWVQSAFPGHQAISVARKSGLIQAMHDILEEIDPSAATTPPVGG